MPYADPEAKRAYHRAYYLAHRDEYLARSREQKQADPERARAYNAQYRATHKASISVSSRARWLRVKYGDDVYERLFREQDGRCALCGIRPDENLQVDHDHGCCDGGMTCGKCIRGLLCHHCNKGLGHFRDNPEVLARAVAYVQMHSERRAA